MRRPNIILVLIDDMGWRDVACCGSTFYETPNLDRMAAEGVRFTSAYAACPVCSPTRASILTGQYPARVGITDFIGGKSRGKVISPPYLDHLPLEQKTIAAALRETGYRTYHVGKWHLGTEPYWPEKHGFDVNIGGCSWGMPKYGYFSPWQNPRLADGPAGEYLTDRLTDEAVRLVRRNGPDPFFMYLAHYAVHVPIQAPEPAVAKYREKARRLGLDRLDPFVEGGPFPCEHKKDKRILRRMFQSDPVYAAMVDNLDINIGRLLQCLDETGRAEDTVVLFTSDNGGLSTAESSPTCNAPLSEGKGWMYEGGVREPLLVRWPATITPGGICDLPVTSPDFYPTLLEMAGADLLPRQHCDGVSFLPALRGARDCARGPIYWHYPHYGNQGGAPGSAVRDGDWKLIEFHEDARLELYNLREDIGETRNLAAARPEIAARLCAALRAWRAEVDARMPGPNPEFARW
jgi:arylsulfatase A-like enzyme